MVIIHPAVGHAMGGVMLVASGIAPLMLDATIIARQDDRSATRIAKLCMDILMCIGMILAIAGAITGIAPLAFTGLALYGAAVITRIALAIVYGL